jgi:hypothetical protein
LLVCKSLNKIHFKALLNNPDVHASIAADHP